MSDEDQELAPPAIVIAGDPSDGFAYYGPFKWATDAVNWAEKNFDYETWWVVDLMDPDEGQHD
jgi:hypothetical protein